MLRVYSLQGPAATRIAACHSGTQSYQVYVQGELNARSVIMPGDCQHFTSPAQAAQKQHTRQVLLSWATQQAFRQRPLADRVIVSPQAFSSMAHTYTCTVTEKLASRSPVLGDVFAEQGEEAECTIPYEAQHVQVHSLWGHVHAVSMLCWDCKVT